MPLLLANLEADARCLLNGADFLAESSAVIDYRGEELFLLERNNRGPSGQP